MGVLGVYYNRCGISSQGADLRLQAEPGGGKPQLPPASTQRNRTRGFQPSLYLLDVSIGRRALGRAHPEGHRKTSGHPQLAHWA